MQPSARYSRLCVVASVAAVALALLHGAGSATIAGSDAPRAAHAPLPAEDLPRVRRDGGYISSIACVDCHPGEHQSWDDSYHASMTQLATPENVLGRFDGSTIDSDGVAYRVFEREGAYWAEMPDPDFVMDQVQMRGRGDAIHEAPRVERRVLMTTGSHHYQTYWVAGDDQYGRLLQTLPLVYLPDEDRWIPRELAFMRPPGDRFLTQWNHHCIKCHSTGGVPGLVNNGRRGAFDTRVAELGISCEACHGPGEEHTRLHLGQADGDLATAARRAADRSEDSDHDPTIVNPSRLSHQRSSQVCGQCHAVFVAANEEHGMEYARKGESYRPGGDVHESRYYIQHPTADPDNKKLAADYEVNKDFFRERWWDDGSILAGGREYTAMSGSACYLRGEMSCLSCHAMHDSDPADQLKRGLPDSEMCIQCHTEPRYTTEVASHTHHSPRSEGSNCLNCHMPYNAYALFSAIRSHQMGSPRIAASIRHGTPNACNLCHLDRTLDWAQRATAEWYEHPIVEVNDRQRETAAGILWMLTGDAAQRAITAWAAGWEPARETSGNAWVGLHLARLLNDPYSVVRTIAGRSLQDSPGFADFDYDAFASRDEQRDAARRAMVAWIKSAEPPANSRAELLYTPDGKLDAKRFDALYRSRDNRPVIIKE